VGLVSITAQVDIIVNAANPMMLGGGGVDGAIHEAAGPKLLEECRKLKATNGIRCPFGEARLTSAGDLPCKFVVHTSGPIYKRDRSPKETLISSYVKSLKLAIDNQCRSIAFPAISCGAYGYPPYEAAKIALKVCCQEKYSQLDIRFYLYDEDMLDTWQEARESLG